MNAVQRIIDQTRVQPSLSQHQRPLQVRLARTSAEVCAAQKLRHSVFSTELAANQLRHELTDSDRFDNHCQHLIVWCSIRNMVVGTYRILTADAARRAGGFYSEEGFDFGALNNHRDRIIELGRSCIHPDYRDGVVLRMLWSALTELLQYRHERYVIGCPSINAADGGLLGAAVYSKLYPKYAADSGLMATPKYPLSQSQYDFDIEPVVPPLIKSYLRMGAMIASEPSLDKEFGSVDLLMVIPAQALTEKRLSRSELQAVNPKRELVIEDLMPH